MSLEDWMNRQLDEVYVSTIIMKEEVYKRINGIPKKQNVYIFLGLNLRGYKNFIDVIVPDEDTTSYWFNKLSEFKGRGIEEFIMVAMIEESHLKKAFKMVYPNVIYMPSMIEFYNNSRPYILQKKHRKLMQTIQNIYISQTKEEAKKSYELLLKEYSNDKLLLMIIDKYVNDIMDVLEYSKEARHITSYTYTYLKMRSRLCNAVKINKVFEDNKEIRRFICEFLKKEEDGFKPSKRNWSLIINEMDSILTEKIKELL